MIQVVLYPDGEREVYLGVFPVIPDDKGYREVAIAYIHGDIVTITSMRYGDLGEPVETVEAVMAGEKVLFEKRGLKSMLGRYGIREDENLLPSNIFKRFIGNH